MVKLNDGAMDFLYITEYMLFYLKQLKIQDILIILKAQGKVIMLKGHLKC